MPPDPILGVLSFVGLFVYAGIGALVASGAMRALDPSLKKARYGPSVRGIAGDPSGNDDAWVGFAAMTALWPAVIAVAVTGATLVAIVIGPVFVVNKIGKYVAKAQVEKAA